MHTFHIPVLGLSYSIDTPLKVARFGISSVVSIIEDGLVERMRAYHCLKSGEPYTAIISGAQDARARRITAYLNLLQVVVNRQVSAIRKQEFEPGNDLCKYFELMPHDSAQSKQYYTMMGMPEGADKQALQAQLKGSVVAGAIDVNIMAKVDNLQYMADGTAMPIHFSDALSALRGFALSDLSSSVVLSAGYNPRLYGYFEQFEDFYPDAGGNLKKKVILKVSDYRSALIQGKILTKKGIWVSEFRIESGLNCGGHAFATEGYLLGPILEEFKANRGRLEEELYELYTAALHARGLTLPAVNPAMAVTVQGGIGTGNEDIFLRTYYKVDRTGWGSPFLLVPEVTNVDEGTLQQLSDAAPEDYYLSNASPLGVPFHNFRKSTSEVQRMERMGKGRPGSPCYKKFLSSNTEFTATPICTASRQYQNQKIQQLQEQGLDEAAYELCVAEVVEKDCLCEGLSSSALLKEGISIPHKLSAVAICPGPNLAYFSGIHSLRDMVDHIYGRKWLLNKVARSNMFVNELRLYVSHIEKEWSKFTAQQTKKQLQYLNTYRKNLIAGIRYYEALLPEMKFESAQYIAQMKSELATICDKVLAMPIPETMPVN